MQRGVIGILQRVQRLEGAQTRDPIRRQPIVRLEGLESELGLLRKDPIDLEQRLGAARIPPSDANLQRPNGAALVAGLEQLWPLVRCGGCD